jgi:hypothetical protein
LREWRIVGHGYTAFAAMTDGLRQPEYVFPNLSFMLLTDSLKIILLAYFASQIGTNMNGSGLNVSEVLPALTAHPSFFG